MNNYLHINNIHNIMIKLRDWQQQLKPKRQLLYNCSKQDGSDSWVSFPIGMGYTFNNYLGNYQDVQIGKHEHTVLCAFNVTTDCVRRGNNQIRRENIAKTLEQHGISNISIDSTEYFRSLPHYKFVVSPEGNGIDCHRHYEALMAGCIPIIEYHAGIEEKYKGCPILWTKDYSEITCDYLNQKYEEMIDKEFDFSNLFIKNYSKEVQDQIQLNGNYWGKRLTGKVWYT
jgi:hypothetical protein